MGGDGSGDFVGALGGYVDVEVEEFVDPVLVVGTGVGEVLGRLVGQVVELGETGTAGAAFGVPYVELGAEPLSATYGIEPAFPASDELGLVATELHHQRMVSRGVLAR